MNKEDIIDNSKNIDVIDYDPHRHNVLNKSADKWDTKENDKKFQENKKIDEFDVPIKEKFTELNYKLKAPEPKRYKLEDIYPVEDCYYLMNIDNLDIFWQRNDDLGERHEEFEDFYNVYGFDIRETWALDYVIAIFLYTRLMAYKYHSAVDFENENEKEFKEDLDKMIFTFGSIVKDSKIFEEKYAEDKEYRDKILEGFDAFKRSFFRLWW